MADTDGDTNVGVIPQCTKNLSRCKMSKVANDISPHVSPTRPGPFTCWLWLGREADWHPGVVPIKDYQYLYDHGVAAVFGPGTNVLGAANAVLDLLEGKRRNR